MTTEDATATLAELEQAHLNAIQREHELREQSHAAELRAEAITAELGDLASSDPEQLDANGNPKPKTHAAKLVAERKSIREPEVSWSQRLDGAKVTTAKALSEVYRHRSENARALADQLEPQARERGRDLERALGDVVAACDAIGDVEREFLDLLAAVPGLGREEVPILDEVNQLRRTATRMLKAGVPIPLPVSLFETDSAPLAVPRLNGPGFVKVENASAEELAAAGYGQVSA